MQESQQEVARAVVLLSIEATRARGGFGLTHVYRLLNEGILEGVKVGKSTRIVEASLDKYLASLPRWKPAGRPVAARNAKPQPTTVLKAKPDRAVGRVDAGTKSEATKSTSAVTEAADASS